MSDFILNILDKIQQYSHSIQKQSMYTNKPWALIDNDLEVQKMIFKNNNELILSKNGKVQIGHWEHLVGTKSILIDRGNDKLLLNEVFLNEDVMILKLDGTKHNFFVFANQNQIPNLDVMDYFNRLILNRMVKISITLQDGKILDMYYEDYGDSHSGHIVRINNKEVPNNSFYTNDGRYINVINSKIQSIHYVNEYITNEGVLKVFQTLPHGFDSSKKVYLDGVLIKNDRIIDFNKSQNLIIEDGKAVKLIHKHSMFKRITNFFNS